MVALAPEFHVPAGGREAPHPSLARLVGERSTLSAIEPPTGASYAERAARLGRRWQARLGALETAGWEPMLDPRRRLGPLFCSSAFVPYGADAQLRRCSYESLCPHCWARSAIDLWRRLDEALFGPEGGRASWAGHDLLLRERIIETRDSYKPVVDGERRQISALRQCLANRLRVVPPWLRIEGAVRRDFEWRRHARAGVLGGLDVMTAGPWRGYGQRRWRVRVRQLLVVPSDAVPPPDQVVEAEAAGPPVSWPELRTPRCRRHDERRVATPNRTRLAESVAWAWRYPRWLLEAGSPAGDVLDYLAARDGLRLVATLGCCRSGTSGARPTVARPEPPPAVPAA